MVSDGAFAFAAICAVLILASAIWAETRFKQYKQLPAHFDARGRATRMASRSFVIWLTPAIFVALIGLMLWLTTLKGQPGINGDPETAVFLCSAIVVAAQVFILWLLLRWARG